MKAQLDVRYSKLAADQARRVYANESAIQHYNRALSLVREQAELADAQTEYDILAGREACYRLTGDRRARQVDLNEMARLAKEMGDAARQIETATRQVALARALGNTAEALHVAEAALDLARQAGDRKLATDSLMAYWKRK